ncbi:uncharacterized protein LOC118430525 [Branchiostoma floridae]|uniref:Uncharacterized protein LOC118430525 n=1 Tax=Branchiostoma floridae TaxID=7739 RepID=A0A9J7N8Y5_BRAFL|nr:uncharacterized protein LOC118430525 [Branchiostoma floridae]XP_035697335.1 uncharacterized protein LOC118430525 [Branchiostoma floridae]XP_035697337.1 uncharacterized protein LOC118430525 [Branchiostoma floridae]
MRMTISKMAYSMDDIEQALDGCAEDKEVATIVDGFQSLDNTARSHRAPEKQEVLDLSSRAWNNPNKGKGKVAKISKMFEENHFPIDKRKRQAMDGERPWMRDLKKRDQLTKTKPLHTSQQKDKDADGSKDAVKPNAFPTKRTELSHSHQNGDLRDSPVTEKDVIPKEVHNNNDSVLSSDTGHVELAKKVDSETSVINDDPVPNDLSETTTQIGDSLIHQSPPGQTSPHHSNDSLPVQIGSDEHTQVQDKQGVDHSHQNGDSWHVSGETEDSSKDMHDESDTWLSNIDADNSKNDTLQENGDHPLEVGGSADGMPFVMESSFARSLQQRTNLMRQSKVEQSTDSDSDASKMELRHHLLESGIAGGRRGYDRHREEAGDFVGGNDLKSEHNGVEHPHQTSNMPRHQQINELVQKLEDSGIGFANSDLIHERENGLTPLSSDGSVRTPSSTEEHRDALEPEHEQTPRLHTILHHRDHDHDEHHDVRPKGRHVKFEDDRRRAVNGLPNGRTDSTKRARDQWTQDQAIVKCSYLSNELVRMSELLDTMDPQELKSALKRRLKRKDAKLIMAMSLLLPRHRHPPASQLHCVRCHKNYNPRFDSERCALSHPNNCVVKKKEHSTSTTFKCRACSTEFRLNKMTFYQEGVNSYMTGLCFSGKHTTNSKDVVYQCHGGPAKTCEDNGCVLYYV